MTSLIFSHMENFYNAMKAEAKKKKQEDGSFLYIYEGKVTALYGSLGISQSHYGRVMANLESLGSIERLQRGVKGTPTIIALYSPPSYDAWSEKFETSGDSHLTKPDRYDKLARRVEELNELVGGLAYVGEAVKNLDERVKKLEKRRVK